MPAEATEGASHACRNEACRSAQTHSIAIATTHFISLSGHEKLAASELTSQIAFTIGCRRAADTVTARIVRLCAGSVQLGLL
jgi:hypothetical protein